MRAWFSIASLHAKTRLGIRHDRCSIHHAIANNRSGWALVTICPVHPEHIVKPTDRRMHAQTQQHRGTAASENVSDGGDPWSSVDTLSRSIKRAADSPRVYATSGRAGRATCNDDDPARLQQQTGSYYRDAAPIRRRWTRWHGYRAVQSAVVRWATGDTVFG